MLDAGADLSFGSEATRRSSMRRRTWSKPPASAKMSELAKSPSHSAASKASTGALKWAVSLRGGEGANGASRQEMHGHEGEDFPCLSKTNGITRW